MKGRDGDLDSRAEEGRWATLGRLLAAIAHEISNALTGLFVASQTITLRAGPALHDEAMEVEQATRRCQELLRQVRRLARGPLLDAPPSVGLADAFEQCSRLLRHRAEMAGVPLEMVEGAGAQVSALLPSVLTALVLLAVEHAPAGQPVRVRADLREPGTVRLELSAIHLPEGQLGGPRVGLARDLLESIGGTLHAPARATTWEIRLPRAAS